MEKILRVFLLIVYWVFKKIYVISILLLPFVIYGIYKSYVHYKADEKLIGIFDTKWTFFVIGWLIIRPILLKISVRAYLKAEEL